MKRSSAPSHLFKKPRFLSPLQNGSPKTVAPDITASCVASQKSFPNPSKPSPPDILRILDEVDSELTESHYRSFPAAIQSQPTSQPIESNSENVEPTVVPETSAASPDARYFSVMWCKKSAKKHKIWEGDAFLIVEGKSVTMKDPEGKILSRGVGYKVQELQNLEDGELLSVGGKQCQIQNEMSSKEFLCACQAPARDSLGDLCVSVTPPNGTNNNRPRQGFHFPRNKLGPSTDWSSRPDALVMPRPNSAHQWKYNPKGLPTTDVVVDSSLSRHLRPHQRQGISFLYECIMGMKDFTGQGAILADEMGLGKTLQCITLLWTVLKQGPYGGRPAIRKALVVTPGSLVKNWEREFRKWLGIGKLPVFAVNSKNTVKDYLRSGLLPILILSYEMFLRHCEALKEVNFDVLICDEGHRLKNAGIRTVQALSSLKTTRRILLSGTPVQNDLKELHALVNFCNPGLLGTASEFGVSFAKPITKGMQQQQISDCEQSEFEEDLHSEGKVQRDELSRLTSQCILRRTHEVISDLLPPKVEHVVMCEPSHLQRTLYDLLVTSEASDLLDDLCVGRGGAGQHLRCLGWLRKVCNHPGLLLKALLKKKMELSPGLQNLVKSFPHSYSREGFYVLSGAHHLMHSGKLSTLDALLSALHKGNPREKVVLVSGHTQTLDVLSELCNYRGYRTLRLDGATPLDKRQGLLEDFNSRNSQCFIFLLSSRAGGVGLTLVGASRIVLFDPDWNPAADLQAIARVWRHGQIRPVHAYRLLTAGSLEETIFQRQVKKQALSDAVIDSHDVTPGTFSLQDLKDLLCPLRGNSHTHDYLNCKCLDELAEPDLPQLEVQNTSSLEDFTRTCQLGSKSVDCPKKNTYLSDLDQWSHIPKEKIQQEVQDRYLAEVYKHVTFVFENRSTSDGLKIEL